MTNNDNFVFEGYEFDYPNGVLYIKYYDNNKDIHTLEQIYSKSEDKVKKIEFFVDKVIHKAIVIVGRGQNPRKLSYNTILCGFTTEQLNNIQENKFLAKTYLKQMEEIAHEQHRYAERFFWRRLRPYNNDYMIGLNFYYEHSFWINGLTNETIDKLYDEIMSFFVSSKIKTTRLTLAKKEICEKYGTYFENKDTELDTYKTNVEINLQYLSFNEIPHFILSHLKELKKESAFWTDGFNDENVDSDNDWIKKYISVLNEKEHMLWDVCGQYLTGVGDSVLENYKNDIKGVLYKLPNGSNDISDFILYQLDDIEKNVFFCRDCFKDNNVVFDRDWVEQYISILSKKELILRRVCNEFLSNVPVLKTFRADLDKKNERLNELIRLLKDDMFSDYLQERNSIVCDIVNCGNQILKNIHDVRIARTKVFSDNSVEDKYLDMLEAQLELLRSSYENYLKQTYGDIPKMKSNLLSSLYTMSFDEALALYRHTVKRQREFVSAAPLDPTNRGFANGLFALYNEYYMNGSILISDYLNRINKKKDSRKAIEKNAYETAVKYFYNANTMEEAERLRNKEKYLADKESGATGEKEVEYALKWLDKSYTVVPKTPSGKYGEPSIILNNPDFIDEPQEYDHIVIGKYGVFLIETKNYAGKLIIDKNGNWIREKNDGAIEGERNPIQQIRRHEKLLHSIIGDINIVSIICLANAKMVVDGIENCPIAIVKSDLLVEFIETYT